MKKFLILLFTTFLIANINYNKNVKVLESLGISSSFIENSNLKKTYRYYYKYRNKYIINSLENGLEIYPIIKTEIQKSKLPKELISVVLAESYMNIKAKSNKKAVGIWQFIPSTAKKYGLKIDDYVDERRDIYKSTRAAIEYLKYLYSFFGKWYLALMAYNAGEARIIEGVVRAKVDKLCKNLGRKCYKDKTIKEYRKIIRNYQHYGRRQFLPLYRLYKKLDYVKITLNDLMKYQKRLKRQYIPRETRKYILKILSISFLFNQQDLEKFAREQLIKAFNSTFYTKVDVPPGTSLYYVSKILDVNYKLLRWHNLHLKYSFTPPYNYYLYIPADKINYFYAKFNPKNRKYVYIYKVKKGDTLSKIAKKFDINLKLILAYNKVGKYLHIGQKLFIPMNIKFIKYKVKKGDSIRAIARKFGVSYKKIMKINDLETSLIKVGQILKIPQKI